jgi:hypothetical protein
MMKWQKMAKRSVGGATWCVCQSPAKFACLAVGAKRLNEMDKDSKELSLLGSVLLYEAEAALGTAKDLLQHGALDSKDPPLNPRAFSSWCCPQQGLFPSPVDNGFFDREQQPSPSVAPEHLPVPQQQDPEEKVKQFALTVPSGHTQEK